MAAIKRHCKRLTTDRLYSPQTATRNLVYCIGANVRTKRGMGRYRLPAPEPLPANEEALAECAILQVEGDAIGQRLKVAPSEALDEAWRLQRRQGYSTRLSACHRLANAHGSIERARFLANGGTARDTIESRLKEARRLVDEAKVAMMNAERESR